MVRAGKTYRHFHERIFEVSLHTDYIKSTLGGTARWRRNLSDKYPDDPRLPLAAEALQAIAKSDPSEVPAHLLDKLHSYRGPEFTTAVRDASRMVGYRRAVFSLTEFVELVLDKLASQPAGHRELAQ
jgi:hypothetical protein